MQPTVNADDTVVLTYDVVEGPQQVLQSVEVAGLEVTNRKVVNQALRFELGKPVDLDEWALARKRLYDTNVFRLVDIQQVPIGDPVNGVQQVKAVVTWKSIPPGRCATASSSRASGRPRSMSSPTPAMPEWLAEVRNPNLFGRALTGGVFGMYQRDRRDASVFRGDLTLVRLARALDAVWVLLARSLPQSRHLEDRVDYRSTGRQRRSALADPRIPDRLRLPLRAQSHDRSRMPATIRRRSILSSTSPS